MKPYYEDDHVTLYCGRMEDVLPALGQFDAAICDPPYGETALEWDRWIDGWPALVAKHTSSMWCFGSMRMFLDRRDDFTGWRLSQDVVWEKQNGSGFAADRFRRVHEIVTHWYRGPWRGIHHEAVRVLGTFGRNGGDTRVRSAIAHTGAVERQAHVDDGTSLARSVLKVRNCNGTAINPTEKPGALLAPLIEYSVPPGGVVLDPFAGSCSTLHTARQLGRRAVGIEANEEYCERAAERLSVPDLFSGGAA